ncbi:amino acid ABC transporter substrate-binding protein [Ideonella sp.]|uniref:amino acid ABC transporter substrate-binding protein n=1 Tax=Ideonella sp. TaxID=1929293 RepID=UPI0037BEE6A2
MAAVLLSTLPLAWAQAPARIASSESTAQPIIEKLRKGGSITIAHRESSVPFSYLDGNQKPVGYAVDICLKVAEAVKKQLALKELEVKYRKVSAADRIQVIESHQAELECGSTTNNAERRAKVAFTIPHYITGARYLVRADSPIKELADFEGKTLVSTKGTTPLKAVDRANKDRLLKIQILEAPDHARAVEMVEKGEADGFAMDDVLLFGLRVASAKPDKLKVVGKLLTIEPLAIMLPKDDPAFKRIVDDELKRLIRSGEAQALYERWFMKPIPPKNTALNLPMNYLLKEFWKYPTDVVPN